MVFLLIKFFVETTYQWNTVTQPFIATNPFSSFVVLAPGMGVSQKHRKIGYPVPEYFQEKTRPECSENQYNYGELFGTT
jgi:hypothetical protein